MRALAVVCVAACVAWPDEVAQDHGLPGRIARAPVEAPAEARGMAYELFTPEGVRPGQVYPLVFAAHGNGEGARKLLRALAPVSSPQAPVFVVAPDYQHEAKYRSPRYEGLDAAFRWVLDTVCAGHPIDRSRIYLQAVSHLGAEVGCPFAWEWHRDARAQYPFRGVFCNSFNQVPADEAETPRGWAVFFVDAAETRANRSFPYVVSQRRCYGAFLARRGHARYHEIEQGGHGVTPAYLAVQREFLAAERSNAGIVGRAPPRGRAAELLSLFWRTAEWPEGWRRLTALRAATDLSAADQAEATRLQRAVHDYWSAESRALARELGKQADIAVYERLEFMAEALGPDDDLGARVAADCARLRGREPLAAEVAARDAFRAALRVPWGDASIAPALQALVAQRPATAYAGYARQTLQALGG